MLHRFIPCPTLTLLVALSAGCSKEPSGGGGSCEPGRDGDQDTISDCDEGRDTDRATDGDAFPDWRDLDADGDLISDVTEAGDGDLSTPPVDTDGDGAPDYLDLDADGDGIPDAAESAGDADQDGIPDFRELDADGDGIPDAVEGAADTDHDGVPDSADVDADGDGIPDAIEAGDSDPATPPRGTDADGVPDFRDLDSDNDFVPDRDEDPNGNGTVDVCSTVGTAPCESSPILADTDGDGTPDLIERVAGSNPADPSSNIPSGDFFFVLPYNGPAQDGTFDFSTSLRRADVFFSVDTTGSFQEEIDQISSTLEQRIIPAVRAQIPDVGYGVGRFEDFPLEPFGLAGDVPFQLLQPITEDPVVIQAAIGDLSPAAGGLDTPESGMEALYQWATGVGLPAFGYPPFHQGGIGGVGFRTYALPIIIQITDARSHLPGDYPVFGAEVHGQEETIRALGAIGAKVIGIDSLENAQNADDPRDELEALALATGARVPPDASGACLTGVGGTPVPPVIQGGSPTCPLVFDVLPNGSGLGDLIVDAIAQLASLGTLDISTAFEGFATDLLGARLPAGVTTDQFIQSVTPVPPPPTGASIVGDEFHDVRTGSQVTFRVTARNTFFPAEARERLFDANIQVIGDRVTLLDVRRVYIVVPADATCPSTVERCNDGFDNDCNGAIDETGCCTPNGPEVCANGIDDDCNGRADSADSTCGL